MKHSGKQKLNQAATATANGINFIVNLAWAAIGVGVLIAAANGIGGAVSWILGVGLIIYAGSKLLTLPSEHRSGPALARRHVRRAVALRQLVCLIKPGDVPGQDNTNVPQVLYHLLARGQPGHERPIRWQVPLSPSIRERGCLARLKVSQS